MSLPGTFSTTQPWYMGAKSPVSGPSILISAVRIGVRVAPHNVPGSERDVRPDRVGPIMERDVQRSRHRDERVATEALADFAKGCATEDVVDVLAPALCNRRLQQRV